MIKQILFDCGGVFADIQFKELMTELTGDPVLGTMFFERMYAPGSPWAKYDQGLYSTEEIYQELIAYFPEIAPEHLKQFMELWPQWLPPIPGMDTIIPELHAAGYPCYLLSNFNRQFEDFRQYCPALRELDGEVVSYLINMMKPHRDIFDYTAAQFGIDPAETLFIDDTQANIDGAIAAGYQACRFTDAEDLRKQLKKILTN